MEDILERRIKSNLHFLCENGYDDINPKNIEVIVTKSDDYFMAQNRNSILVSKDCNKLNDSALLGVLAHELIHLIDYRSLLLKIILQMKKLRL